MILFLDFDGVLHHHDVVVSRRPDGYRFPVMRGPGKLFEWAPILDRALADIPEVQIVLSTRWVWWFALDFCRASLPPGLAAKVQGATWEGSWAMPEGWIHLPRCEQIRLHAERYGIEDWIAIDDDADGLTDKDRRRFVVCDPERGLSAPETFAELAARLSGSILRYPPLDDEMRAWDQMTPVGKEIP